MRFPAAKHIHFLYGAPNPVGRNLAFGRLGARAGSPCVKMPARMSATTIGTIACGVGARLNRGGPNPGHGGNRRFPAVHQLLAASPGKFATHRDAGGQLAATTPPTRPDEGLPFGYLQLATWTGTSIGQRPGSTSTQTQSSKIHNLSTLHRQTNDPKETGDRATRSAASTTVGTAAQQSLRHSPGLGSRERGHSGPINPTSKGQHEDERRQGISRRAHTLKVYLLVGSCSMHMAMFCRSH